MLVVDVWKLLLEKLFLPTEYNFNSVLQLIEMPGRCEHVTQSHLIHYADRERICRQFAATGSCRFNPCRFEHVSQGKNQKRHSGQAQQREKDPEEYAFGAWKAQTSLNRFGLSMTRPRQLGQFFKEARRLIDINESTRQNVVRHLSSEGSLQRIRELIEQDFSSLSDLQKKALFEDAVIAFLEIITSPDVLGSLVLETAVVTIYNCIFGPGGRRARPLLEFLADVVYMELVGDPNLASCHLELSLLAFSQVVGLNSTAFIQYSLQSPAERFADLFRSLHALDCECSLFQSLQHLDIIQRRLKIGLVLPNLIEGLKSIQPARASTGFITQRDPPGGRHDNDHADISSVRIMPSFGEISSSRAEYLPVKDSRQWHLNGIAGLLDRNFRLLREDTVGQLRDAIHAEFQVNMHQGTQRTQTRMHVYRQVVVHSMILHRFAGMQFLVKFTQPPNVRQSEKNKRAEWWNVSKRLQSSALVCLLDPNGFAIFCTVAAPDRGYEKHNDKKKWNIAPSLSDNPKTASIILELVEPTEENWQYVLDCQAANNARQNLSVSLVEFPGILLPSFQPTLLALQRMQKSEDIPMSEFLATDHFDSQIVMTNIPPPVYAASPGFYFDLKCLMDDGSKLEVRHSQPVDIEKLQQHSALDDAQAVALTRTLQRRIGCIQGPPGTGKSYTGVALIKVLLANKAKVRTEFGPIICVCYTNHALDQLLEDIQKNKITTQIIRIGSQSKSETLEPFNLRTVSREVEKTRLEKRGQWELHNKFDLHDEQFQKLHLNSSGSYASLKYYLQRFHHGHYCQLFGEDEDGFMRQSNVDPSKTLRSWLNSGRTSEDPPRSMSQLYNVHIDAMTTQERRTLYENWVSDQRENVNSRAQSIFASHAETKTEWDKIRDELDLRCLRAADVIGVTTTGMARNLNMLRRLKSKALICEEAGEVMEAHMLTSLLPSVEHLILIGDHQQLRPQIQNYELSRESSEGRQYALDRSLFERLVEPDDEVGVQIPLCTLETQRRMHPSISRLIRETLYPKLKDSPSVMQYPDVAGMRRRLFWFDHRCAEAGATTRDPTATSHWNDHEIELTASLVNHLLKQGVYRSGDIAVITPYLGQLHRMRRKLALSYAVTLGDRDQEDLDKAGFTAEESEQPRANISKSTLLQTLRVATVDNFQGEEAKVVVVSLVRSNSQNRCGFLRTPNRINVLLSRAKHGMYIIGNSETSRKVDMWGKVLNILEKDGNLGPRLELTCPRHPDTPIEVKEPEDFEQFSPEGGCSLQCGKRLQCGHPCKQKCHSEMLHQTAYCAEPCPRPLKGCTHICPRFCGDKCPTECMVPIFDLQRFLPCGHEMATLPCWQAQDLTTVKCQMLVEKNVLQCGHIINIECYIDVNGDDYLCGQVCDAILSCGHRCKSSCRQCVWMTPEGPVVNHGTCKQKCGRLYSTCSHACATECHGKEACPACTSPCDVQCGHSQCPQKCSEPCPPCAVEHCLSSCSHSSCSMPCAAPCDHIPCSLRCEKPLPCGHQCPSVCGETCPSETYCQTCAYPEIKGTIVDFLEMKTYEEIDLTEVPCVFPQCGHFLTIESMDGQMDLKKHYNLDETEKPISIASSSEPFSIEDIRTCATCRGSLRSLSRYGRLVRRAMLDEATKKFILYANREYVPLAQALPGLLSKLQDDTLTKEGASPAFQGDGDIRIEGTPAHQVSVMGSLIYKISKPRWHDLLALRRKISEYQAKVKVEEQPFNQVCNMVENTRRRKKTSGQFNFDESVLQTKGQIQATALLLRLDTALLSDFFSLKRLTPINLNQKKIFINLERNRAESRCLIKKAALSQRILQRAEGNIFLAQLYALELQHVNETSLAESLRECGNAAIEEAQRLCDEHPTQTRGLSEEIEGTILMLRGSAFYTPVTNGERMAVLAAMAKEFRSTGHWYYCENGHPFTIGECGGAMELSRCPECGSAVGGQNHLTTNGVSHAQDLEQILRDMHI